MSSFESINFELFQCACAHENCTHGTGSAAYTDGITIAAVEQFENVLAGTNGSGLCACFDFATSDRLRTTSLLDFEARKRQLHYSPVILENA